MVSITSDNADFTTHSVKNVVTSANVHGCLEIILHIFTCYRSIFLYSISFNVIKLKRLRLQSHTPIRFHMSNRKLDCDLNQLTNTVRELVACVLYSVMEALSSSVHSIRSQIQSSVYSGPRIVQHIHQSHTGRPVSSLNTHRSTVTHTKGKL